MTGNIIPRMTPQDLDEILAGYNIGKKPFAKLLGWGETAIINIKPVDGYLPDSDYVRCLERLGKDPLEYAGLLLEHKDRITDIAFAKSLDAVKGYFELSDACEAAHYVWKNMPEESRSLLRLESILGWGELYSLCFFDEPIYTDVDQTGSNKSPYQRIAEKIDRYGCIRPDGLYPSDNTCEPTNEEKELLKLVASVLVLCWMFHHQLQMAFWMFLLRLFHLQAQRMCILQKRWKNES